MTELEKSDLQFVVIPKEIWEKVLSGLEEVKNLLNKTSEEDKGNEWLSSEEARKMLKICPKTWQTYRDQRKIPFSQFGRKIRVKRADIMAFLNNHCINSHKG